MTQVRSLRRWSLLGAAVVAGWVPEAAYAQECSTISGGAPIIYGAGGSAQRPLIGAAASVLQSSSNPVFVVYKDDGGACTGIDALAGTGPATITGTASYFDTVTGARSTCTLPLAGQTVQFASMGNGPLLCPLITDLTLVDGIIDVTGPISSVNVIVRNESTQQGISSEALYLVYGFGATAGVAPWTNPDPSYFIRRNQNSYVQQYIGLATGLPASKFYGVDAGTNNNSVAWLVALANPEEGISFTSGEVADANRATVRTLAYQHKGQTAAWWPDSSATAFDKVNVRNGTYFLWGPGQFYGLEGASPGTYADANVQRLLEFLSGQSQPAGTTKTITDVAIDNRNVPTCAMRVQRDGDLAPIYAYRPEEPCHCYFDFRATGATSCETCDDSNPCASGTCRNGYCEEY